MRIFRSTLRKLLRRPASRITLGLLVGLLALIIIVSATRIPGDAGTGGGEPGAAAAYVLITFPAAYDAILGFILGLGGLFAVIYGAAIAGSEWNWGTLKTAVARGESRSRYMLITFAGIAAMLALGLLLTFAIGVLAAVIGANIAGVSTAGLTDADTLASLPGDALRVWFAIVEECALGFAVATLARSQLAGIGAGIAFYFGETFSALFLPDVVKYMPFDVARATLGPAPGGPGGATFAALDPNTALAFVALWLAAALLLTALFTERVEITQ